MVAISGTAETGWQILDPLLLRNFELLKANKQIAEDQGLKYDVDLDKEAKKYSFGPMSKEELKNKIRKEGLSFSDFENIKVYDQ